MLWQKIEKDALFGQLIDSDFGDGNTDSSGFVLRGGYTVARNWTINATLFLNELSNDVLSQALALRISTTGADSVETADALTVLAQRLAPDPPRLAPLVAAAPAPLSASPSPSFPFSLSPYALFQPILFPSGGLPPFPI